MRILAKNNDGYLAIKKLLSYGYQEGQKDNRTPHITWDVLTQYVGNIILLVDYQDSGIGQAIIKKDRARAEQLAQQWLSAFQTMCI